MDLSPHICTDCLVLVTRQLCADLAEDIYIKLQEVSNDCRNPFRLSKEALRPCKGPYLRLKKILYGLKQAPRRSLKLTNKTTLWHN